tara:strand:- start:260 stop:472 length:213 start_codon:yes stop_codon:yes gene_type:complete
MDEDELFIVAAYADDIGPEDLKKFRLIQEITSLKNEIRQMMKATSPNYELIKRYQKHIQEMEADVKGLSK